MRDIFFDEALVQVADSLKKRNRMESIACSENSLRLWPRDDIRGGLVRGLDGADRL